MFCVDRPKDEAANPRPTVEARGSELKNGERRASGLRAGHKGRPDPIHVRFACNRALEMLIGVRGRPADDNADRRPTLTPELRHRPTRRYPLRAAKDEADAGVSATIAKAGRSRFDVRENGQRSQWAGRRTRARRQAGVRHNCRLFLRRAWVQFASSCPPRPIARLPTPVSRASLRRAVPSFTVEVRRRPRLAAELDPRLAFVGGQDLACRI